MKRRFSFIVSVSLLCGVVSLYAQDVPNAVKFLPAPPKQDSSVQYINDFLQYGWGKAQRATDRAEQASADMPQQATTYAKAFSEIIGLEITEKSTPKLYTLFDYALRMSEIAAETPQNYYNTERPYVSFSEHTLVPTYENTYRSVGSYPCVQAMAGWLSGLIMVEVVPALQDEVLARGHAFGVSDLISGYNWYTDVTAGRFVGTALLAYFHSQGSFNAMVAEAKKEYAANGGPYSTARAMTRADEDTTETDTTDVEKVIPYVAVADLPDSYKYLPGPPDESSSVFGYDVAQHMDGKALRPYSDGKQAVEDVNNGGPDGWCKIYSSAFGKTLSEKATPQLYELLKRTDPSANAACQSAKSGYLRKRPYVYLNESTAYPADEDNLRATGSYPSGHSAGGWLAALVLAEINPAAQDALYARAYQFGQGRVITGYHWQSDVDDGRLVASAVFARLHLSSEFLTQMDRAKAEFNGGATRINAAETANEADAPVYNLQGIRVEGQPTQHGIYIQGNKKIAR